MGVVDSYQGLCVCVCVCVCVRGGGADRWQLLCPSFFLLVLLFFVHSCPLSLFLSD